MTHHLPPEPDTGQDDDEPDEELLTRARDRLATFVDADERAEAEKALRRAEGRRHGRQ